MALVWLLWFGVADVVFVVSMCLCIYVLFPSICVIDLTFTSQNASYTSMGVSLSQLAIRDRLSEISFDRCVPLRTVKSFSTATYNPDYPW